MDEKAKGKHVEVNEACGYHGNGLTKIVGWTKVIHSTNKKQPGIPWMVNNAFA